MKKDSSLVLLGEGIKQERHKRSWTQEDLAERAGLHWTYVGQTERGERNIAVKNIIKIAKAFGLKASELFKISSL